MYLPIPIYFVDERERENKRLVSPIYRSLPLTIQSWHIKRVYLARLPNEHFAGEKLRYWKSYGTSETHNHVSNRFAAA